MIYISGKKSDRKVHRIGCFHLDRISNENRRRFQSYQEIQTSGHQFCKCCSLIYREMRREKNQMNGFCRDNRLSYSYNESDDTVEVRSRFDRWKITAIGYDEKFYLYHKSVLGFRNDKSPLPGYHYQKVWRKSLRECIDYIVQHDNYRWDIKYAPKEVSSGKEIPLSEAELEAFAVWKEEKIRKIQSIIELVEQAECRPLEKSPKGRHKWERCYVPNRKGKAVREYYQRSA